jgi:hypothetical protein
MVTILKFFLKLMSLREHSNSDPPGQTLPKEPSLSRVRTLVNLLPKVAEI